MGAKSERIDKAENSIYLLQADIKVELSDKPIGDVVDVLIRDVCALEDWRGQAAPALQRLAARVRQLELHGATHTPDRLAKLEDKVSSLDAKADPAGLDALQKHLHELALAHVDHRLGDGDISAAQASETMRRMRKMIGDRSHRPTRIRHAMEHLREAVAEHCDDLIPGDWGQSTKGDRR